MSLMEPSSAGPAAAHLPVADVSSHDVVPLTAASLAEHTRCVCAVVESGQKDNDKPMPAPRPSRPCPQPCPVPDVKEKARRSRSCPVPDSDATVSSPHSLHIVTTVQPQPERPTSA